MKMTQEDKITQHLDTINALERVTELVHTRLVECGWRDQVRLACRKSIAENGGKVPTVDELINNITANARSMVPDAVKQELLFKLETILIDVDKSELRK